MSLSSATTIATAQIPSGGVGRDWPHLLLAILGIGSLLRIAIWAWFAQLAPQIDDEQAHVILARNIVESGEYRFGPEREPTSLRPPLYPAFVAVVFSVFGEDNFQAVRLIHIAMSLVLVVIVYRLGRDMISKKAGLWSAAMMCFYPTFIGYCYLMLTEIMFTLLLMLGVYSISIALRRRSYRYVVLAGVVLGLGALTRSILFPLAPVLAMYLLVVWRGTFLQRFAAVAAFSVPFAGVLTPWAIRNTQLQRTFVPVDCMGGRNFMMGNYEYTPLYRSWDAIAIRDENEWLQVMISRHPEYAGSTQGQLDKFAFGEAVHFVRDNPGLTAQRDVIKFFDFWGLERELIAGMYRGYFGPIPSPVMVGISIAICGSYVLVLFVGAFGASRRCRLDLRLHLLLLLIICFVCAVHTVVFAHSRYHLPIMPLVMLFAAAVFSESRSEHRSLRRFVVSASFCALVAIGWGWNAAAGDLSRLFNILRS